MGNLMLKQHVLLDGSSKQDVPTNGIRLVS